VDGRGTAHFTEQMNGAGNAIATPRLCPGSTETETVRSRQSAENCAERDRKEGCQNQLSCAHPIRGDSTFGYREPGGHHPWAMPASPSQLASPWHSHNHNVSIDGQRRAPCSPVLATSLTLIRTGCTHTSRRRVTKESGARAHVLLRAPPPCFARTTSHDRRRPHRAATCIIACAQWSMAATAPVATAPVATAPVATP